MIKEKVKQIEQNINEILEESKDFLEINTEFSALLKELKNNKTNLENSKKELLNFLLKHSKRKILFEFEYKNKGTSTYYNRNRKYTIGLNKFGLGILSSDWEHNLRNINDYYSREKFENLCKVEEFVKEFLKHTNKHLKGEHKETIKKCMDVGDILENKTIEVGEIIIQIKTQSNDFNILYEIKGGENIYILEQDEDGNLTNYDFSFKNLNGFSKLCESKTQIIDILKRELKEFKVICEHTKTKLTEIKEELSPYEALEEI